MARTRAAARVRAAGLLSTSAGGGLRQCETRCNEPTTSLLAIGSAPAKTTKRCSWIVMETFSHSYYLSCETMVYRAPRRIVWTGTSASS